MEKFYQQVNNNVIGFATVKRVAFNILWLTKSGPIALFTGNIEIMSNTSCSSIKILQSVSLGSKKKDNCGKYI